MRYLIRKPEDVQYVREHYHVTEVDIAEDIAILKSWIQQQKHLPQDLQDDVIESFLLRNKFSVEKTKKKIDAYYSLKAIYRRYYEDFGHVVPSKQATLIMPLQQLTDQRERIMLYKTFKHINIENFDFVEHIKCSLNIFDLTYLYTYCAAEAIVIDCESFSTDLLKRMPPSLLNEYIKIIMRGYSGKINSIHIINASPTLATILLALVKPIMKAKLYNRITIHKTADDLFKVLPRRCFPSDYGGEGMSVAECANSMDKWLAINRGVLDKLSQQLVDEKSRIGDPYNSEMYGTDGTFKRINLD